MRHDPFSAAPSMPPEVAELVHADLPRTLALLESLAAEQGDARAERLAAYRAFVESPKFRRLPADDVWALQLKRWILRDWLSRPIAEAAQFQASSSSGSGGDSDGTSISTIHRSGS